MKKILITLLTLIFTISIAVSVNAATTGVITLTASKTEIKAGEEFSVVVSASDSNYLNTIEYSGINVKDKNGNLSTSIKVKSIQAIDDKWSKMTEGSITYFVYMGEKTTSLEKVFQVTLIAENDIKVGEYTINAEGLKVYSTNLEDDTTEIGTKSVVVEVQEEPKTEPEKDTTAPVGKVTYKTNADGSVTATVTFEEENVTITNNDGKNTYVFTEKGEFTFIFKDAAGNEGTATAKVESIEGEEPPVNPDDSTADEDDEDKELPQTGIEDMNILSIVALAAIAITSFVLYKKYKDI